MARRILSVLTLLLPLVTSASAQDPLKTLPQAYKLEFENEWVKVTRVHYAPQVKLPGHDHTETGAAYVYLNDSGPVLFRHVGASYGAITRPATKTGSVRLYRSVREVHEVENPNDTPSDFLRVEFKTPEDTLQQLRGKHFPDPPPATETSQKLHFENAQIRLTRFVCTKQKACDLSTTPTEPALLISLTPVQLEGWGTVKNTLLPAGKAIWLDAGKRQSLKNLGESAVELLRFEFKTKPVKGAK